jgi:tetratricopeptide (TPR) repeat protein/DNA-binding XRE family transcriptional regulator
MDDPSLSDWMRRQRATLDLTQEALAEEVGCALQTIRAFENGWRRPSRPLAERLATVLAIPPAQREAFLRAARAPIPKPSPRAAPAPAAPAGPQDPATYLAELAAAGLSELFGPAQQRWLERLDGELETIRGALAWALEDGAPDQASRVTLALGAASAIDRFWHGRGHQAEGQRWLERGIELADRHGLDVPPDRMVEALRSAGWLARIRGESAQAMALLRRCVAICRTIGDNLGMADALDTLGDIAIFDGDAIAASWFHEESLALRRALARPDLVALSLNGLGHAAVLRGYYERAAEHFQEALAILKLLDDPRSTALSLHGLGLARLRQGNLDAAAPALVQAMALFHSLDNALDVGICLELLGELLALRVLTAGGDPAWLAQAAQLWGASERLFTQTGVSLSPPELARRDALISAARLRVGPVAFQARWAEGAALTQERAVTLGREVGD